MRVVTCIRPVCMPVRGVCRCCAASLVGTAYGPPSLSEPVSCFGVRAVLLCLLRNRDILRGERVIVVAGKNAVSLHVVEEKWCVCCNCGREWHAPCLARSKKEL